jgi:hypothetical protein
MQAALKRGDHNKYNRLVETLQDIVTNQTKEKPAALSGVSLSTTTKEVTFSFYNLINTEKLYYNLGNLDYYNHA